ncbi:MAG: Ig-like domain-containing protein [Tannerellaceae bacterium]|jgi:hypothetical protein|nr:Ig-like domain-containing protein [Tannerellaceae bacterium]
MKTTYLFKSFCILALGLSLAGCEEKFGEGVTLTDIQLESESTRVLVGNIVKFNAYPVPWDCTDYEFTWETANPSVATVSPSGRIDAVDLGTTRITVSQGSIKKEFSVEVYEVYEETLPGKIETLGAKGAWHFEDANNLEKATIGNDLLAYKMDGNKTTGSPSLDGFSHVPGPTKRNYAVRVPKQSYFRCDHGFAASGGGSKVNEYTLLINVRIPKLGIYYSIFETDDLGMSSDSDGFIRPGADWGVRGSYTENTLFEANKWYQMVITLNNNGQLNYYLNGSLVDTKEMPLNSHAAWLTEAVLLFADEDGEDNEFDIATVAIWDRELTADEVSFLKGF